MYKFLGWFSYWRYKIQTDYLYTEISLKLPNFSHQTALSNVKT